MIPLPVAAMLTLLLPSVVLAQAPAPAPAPPAGPTIQTQPPAQPQQSVPLPMRRGCERTPPSPTS
ncbi:hypothetical protein ACE7GA_23620 [Roseomonas sp. CCTCC AB2023176]|uniref:hypothetical protein n=1 Tax=Roseomonas sp. CCTCC AB2023176 TaxID=3342640 RepID=UPI0035DA8A47